MFQFFLKLRKEKTFWMIFFCWVVSLAYLFWMTRNYSFRGDGGIPLAIVKQMMQGDLLYRDIRTFWMPGTFYLLRLFFDLAGMSLTIARVLSFFNFFFLYLLVFGISRKMKLSRISCGLVLLFYSLMMSFPVYYNHNWLAVFFSAAALFYLLFRWGSFSLRDFLILGLINGLAVSFNQWQGVGLFLSLMVINWTEGNFSFRERFQRFLVFVGGLVIIPLSWCFLFWRSGLLPELLRETVLFPLFHYYRGNMQSVPGFFWWMNLTFIFTFLLGIKFRLKDLSWQVRFVLVFALVFFFSGVFNTSREHTLMDAVYLFPLFAFFVGRIWLPGLKQSFMSMRNWRTTMIRIFQVLRLFSLPVFIFFFLLDFSQSQIYYRYYLFNSNYPVRTERGTIYTSAYYGNYIEKILSEIESRNFSGEKVWIGPYLPYFYFISELENPLPFVHLGPEHYSPETLSLVIQALEDSAVEYVFYLPSETAFHLDEANDLNLYLQKNFQPELIFESSFLPLGDIDPEDGLWRRI